MQVIEEFTAAGFERQRRAFIPAQGNAPGGVAPLGDIRGRTRPK